MLPIGIDHEPLVDVFQVVLSQRFSVPFTLPPFALYRALQRVFLILEFEIFYVFSPKYFRMDKRLGM